MHLTLHITERCNMRCRYCYTPHQDLPPMSLDTARQALVLGARLNPGRACGIAFFGGEPLLHPELVQAIVAEGEARRRRGEGRYHFKLTTNGLALTEAFLDWCLEHHVLVAMSCDGLQAAHDTHRVLPGGAPSFEHILPRLRLLLRARPHASVLMVVNPDTAALLPESVAFLVEEGVRYLLVSLNYAALWDEESFARLEASWRVLAGRYLAWMRAGLKLYLSPIEVKLASHIQGERWIRCRCALAEVQLSVTPEGWLVPCVQFTRGGPEWRVGHVETGIDEPARQRIRVRAAAEKAGCRGCGIEARCFHTCGCLNWQTTGSLVQVPPILCRYEQMMLEIADGLGETLFREKNPVFLGKHYDPVWPLTSLAEDLRQG